MGIFKESQILKHVGNNMLYAIVTTPNSRKLSGIGEEFYEYKCISSGEIWIRCKSEMEDGRFLAL